MATYDTIIDKSESTLLGVGLLGNVLITKDANTPAGDPVIVNSGTLAGIGAVTSFTVANGATFNPSSLLGIAAGTTYNIDGGILQINPTAGISALNIYNFSANGGEIVVQPGLAINLNTPVAGWSAKSLIDFPSSTKVVASLLGGNTVLTAYNGLVPTGQSITLAGNVYSLSGLGTKTITTSDTSGGILVCFLAGVLIETSRGEVAVEDLQVGDEVAAQVDGEQLLRPIVWLGSRHIEVAVGDLDRAPIRIRKDAVSPGIPRKDLLVTPEHCLLIDGQLMPARMLVNDRSILRDTSLRSFDIFHVETRSHSILLADGMPSESYLDTGNRNDFLGEGIRVAVPRAWHSDAAAPLSTDISFAAMVWTRLDERATALGYPARPVANGLTTDADLRLDCGGGVTVRSLRQDGDRHFFRIPTQSTTLTLTSRTFRPSDVVGAFADDRRKLGVCVGTMALWRGYNRQEVTAHLSDDGVPGWFPQDSVGVRWTNGSASLPLDLSQRHDLMLLEVQVLQAGPYAVPADIDLVQAA